MVPGQFCSLAERSLVWHNGKDWWRARGTAATKRSKTIKTRIREKRKRRIVPSKSAVVIELLMDEMEDVMTTNGKGKSVQEGSVPWQRYESKQLLELLEHRTVDFDESSVL